MITIKTEAHPMAVEAAIRFLAEHDYTPTPLVFTGSDGQVVAIYPEPWYHDWLTGMRMAWANRLAPDSSDYRWSPESVSIDAPSDWQAELDARLEQGVQNWAKLWKDTYLDLQVKRWMNGIRDDEVHAALDKLTADELQTRVAAIQEREKEAEE